MNMGQNEAVISYSKDSNSKNVSNKQITRDKWLSGLFVSILVVLCLVVFGCLYVLAKDYLTWTANKHKAQCDLLQIKESADRRRAFVEEEIKRLKVQKQERLNELSTLKNSADQLNSLIAQREALLSSTDEGKKQLEKLKEEAKNLQRQNEQLTTSIDEQRQALAKSTGQKDLLSGQCSDLTTQIAYLKKEHDLLQSQVTERKLALAESEQAHAAVQEKQQQAARIQNQINVLQQEYTNLSNTKLSINGEISTARQRQAAVTAELKIQESRLTALKDDVDVLEKSKSTINKEIIELHAAQKSADENLAGIQQKVANATALQNKMVQGNAVLQQTQDQLNREITSLRVESGKLQGEITQLRIQHKKLTEANADLEKPAADKQKTGSSTTSSDKH